MDFADFIQGLFLLILAIALAGAIWIGVNESKYVAKCVLEEIDHRGNAAEMYCSAKWRLGFDL